MEEARRDEEEVKVGRYGDDDEDEGSGPPVKLALLQVRLLVRPEGRERGKEVEKTVRKELE